MDMEGRLFCAAISLISLAMFYLVGSGFYRLILEAYATESIMKLATWAILMYFGGGTFLAILFVTFAYFGLTALEGE